uniref:Uncharacterized protein n=1 Tax=Oryzias latipes TaxID=8090 RepID=A0A3B3HKR7_ORYLA
MFFNYDYAVFLPKFKEKLEICHKLWVGLLEQRNPTHPFPSPLLRVLSPTSLQPLTPQQKYYR